MHYARYTVLCALCTIHGTLYSVHYTRYTVLCALYTVHCTLCTIHGTLYSVHCAPYTVHCTLCTIHGTLYSLHCALYTVHCTLCTRHGTLYSVHYTAGFLRCLQKPTQNCGLKRNSWNSIPMVFFSFRPDGQSQKKGIWTQLDDLRQPSVFRYLVNSPQNGGMKPTSWNSIPRVFFRFAPMGIVEKTSFERNWTTFVNPAFCAAGKSRPKMVVWSRPRGIRSKGCFFVSPRWGNSKKRVFNAIGRHSSTRLFALLAKAQQKWWYETDLVEFDHKGVFFFRLDGETRQNEFSTQLDDLGQTGVLRCLENPTQNGGLKPTSWNSITRVFFRFVSLPDKKKQPWDQILQFRFHATILGGLFQAAEKAGFTKVVQLRSKRVFLTFPILARQIKKPPWVQILKFQFHATILGGLFQAAQNAGVTKVVEFRSKRVFSTFPIGAKRKNSLWIEFYNFSFMPPFWVGFSKQRKKPGSRKWSNCVQNAFC